MVKKAHTLLVLLALITAMRAQDTVNGYVCSRMVDAMRWITLDNPTVISNQGYFTANNFINLGFEFQYFGYAKSWVKISDRGVLSFENAPPSGTSLLINSSTLFPFGQAALSWRGTSYWKYQCVGSPGSRTFVFEYQGTLIASAYFNWKYQIHLCEADNSIWFVYGMPSQATEGAEIVIADSPETYICIEGSHAVGHRTPGHTQTWPGADHCYAFVPQPCLARVEAYLDYGSFGSATLRMRGNAQATRYRIEYGREGFARGTGTFISTAQSQIAINGLDEGVAYDFYVTPFCADSTEGITCHVRYWGNCAASPHNQIPYWDLRHPDVTCRSGGFNSLLNTGIIDFGCDSIASRHTVCSDTAERDPRTLNQLHIVPPGHCHSVRLGNWNNGGERESITYRLHVDTNDYDLLLLRYAIVEQNPGHPAEEQPFFTFGIYDTAGSIVDSCYYANFVAGDLSGWNTLLAGRIVWHDWQAVGVDLSPLHGMDIDVVLDNADCAGSMHYGYGYFTLESGTKHIRAAYCGPTVTNTLRVPQGFTYRWYRAGSPATTLSTADTLVVSDTGTYFCEASYLLQNSNCSILLSAYGGSLYPAAAFDIEPQNICSSLCRFINRSFVARDSLQPTPNPCDSYLWVFDDGTTSTLASPTHQFQPGTHTVTLYAMLSDGACVDSATQAFAVADSASVYITELSCPPYRFGDSVYTASGDYIYDEIKDGCISRTCLHLTVLPSYNFVEADTFPLGQTYTWRGRDIQCPGVYADSLTTAFLGCDSIYTLVLSSIERHDTLVCEDALPLRWHGRTLAAAGTDTLAFPLSGGADSLLLLTIRLRNHPGYDIESQMACDSIPYYSIPIPDTLDYRCWTADSVIESLSHIVPAATTEYILWLDYLDEPSCPVSRTLTLAPLHPIVARIEVQPDWISEGESDITATDRSQNTGWREWYFDNVLQTCTDPTCIYHSGLQGDSVSVMLVVGLDSCTDTARTTIGIRHRELLWFPNVFTPSRADNNRFRGYGVNICDYDLQIFTRWGERVFRTHDIEEGWDGTWHGTPLPQKAYAYVCTYTSPEGGKQRVYGTVTLLR